MRKDLEEHIYRVYITEALKLITENTAHAVMGDGKVLKKSWQELLDINKSQEYPKSGDDIALDIMARAGLHQKGGD